EAAEERQRIADEMPQAPRSPRGGLDIALVVLARLGLLQDALDAGDVERDVAIAPVKSMRPRQEREAVRMRLKPARAVGPRPGETGDDRAQKLVLVQPRRRLRLHAGNEDDARRAQFDQKC